MLPIAARVTPSGPATTLPTETVRQRLALEVAAMISAGHLRPGYHNAGLTDHVLGHDSNAYLAHYLHNPAETFYTLLRALPHLPADLQAQTRTYLQSEYADYGHLVHVGWQEGAPREAHAVPPEVEDKMRAFGHQADIHGSSWDDPSPGHVRGLRALYGGEPLANGRYEEIGTDLRAPGAGRGHPGRPAGPGERDGVAGRALLWIDNAQHTWQHVVTLPGRPGRRGADRPVPAGGVHRRVVGHGEGLAGPERRHTVAGDGCSRCRSAAWRRRRREARACWRCVPRAGVVRGRRSICLPMLRR